jgi:hypothetical protein
MANPNIFNTSLMYGNNAFQAVSTVTANIVQNVSGSNLLYKVNSLTVANINTNPSAVNLTVEVNNNGSNTAIIKNVVIPANSMMVILGKDTPVYLLENQSIQLTAGYNSSLSAVINFDIMG